MPIRSARPFRRHWPVLLLLAIAEAIILKLVTIQPAWLLLPVIGVCLVLTAALRKIRRTGAFWTWQLGSHRDDHFEHVLKLYGYVLIFSAILLSWMIG